MIVGGSSFTGTTGSTRVLPPRVRNGSDTGSMAAVRTTTGGKRRRVCEVSDASGDGRELELGLEAPGIGL